MMLRRYLRFCDQRGAVCWVTIAPALFLIGFGLPVLIDGIPEVDLALSLRQRINWPLNYLTVPWVGGLFAGIGLALLVDTRRHLPHRGVRIALWVAAQVALWNMVLYAVLAVVEPPRPVTLLAASAAVAVQLTLYFCTNILVDEWADGA